MAVFVQWVTDRAVQIDSETGLTSLSLELAQEAISALPSMDVSLLEFVNRTQLFLFFLDASLSLASPSLLDSSPQPFLTLSDWMHYSTHEIIQSLFTIPTIDVEKVVECTLHLNGLKADAILGFITDYHGQDKKRLFFGFLQYQKAKGVAEMLSQELAQFVEFLETNAMDTTLHFTLDEISVLKAVVEMALAHPLLPAIHVLQLQHLRQCLVVLDMLGVTSPSIPDLAGILSSDEAFCASLGPLSSLPIPSITDLLARPSSLLLSRHAQKLLTSHSSSQSLQLLLQLQPACFPFLPAELPYYLLTPLLLKETSYEASNTASFISQHVQTEWFDSMILRVVDEEVKSMSE